MPLHVAGPLSSLDRAHMAPGAEPEAVIEVPVRTLDSVLDGGRSAEPIDFLSIDVEGHEIEVLRGFDFARWQPRLILVEDHVADLGQAPLSDAAGYRLIRRYENNGWYVPRAAAEKVQSGRPLGNPAQILSGAAVARAAQSFAAPARQDHGRSPRLIGSLFGGCQSCVSS